MDRLFVEAVSTILVGMGVVIVILLLVAITAYTVGK